MLNDPWLQSNIDILLTQAPSLQLVLRIFIINLIFSCFIAYLLAEFLNSPIVKSKRFFFLLLASVGVFVPILGSITAIIAALLIKKYGKEFQAVELNVYPQEEYTRVNAVKTIALGTGWANIRLHSTKFTATERQQALLSISKGLPRDSNTIYNELLSDDMEELRVCAFSMLESQQDYLHNQITHLLKKYKDDNNTANKRAFFAKQLALLYWELVYRKLSDEKFREILLERSTFYAKQALQVLVDDKTLWILLSRINFENGNVEEGLKDLDIASTYDAPQSKIIPYLAEFAFNNNDYSLVKKYLNSDSSLEYIFKINKIVKFWCQS